MILKVFMEFYLRKIIIGLINILIGSFNKLWKNRLSVSN